uniref:Uncharacterized protein n=1 Tax=viral metagenome TaxID=1070528 RepID=A0A6C0I5U0_9ZZZZ
MSRWSDLSNSANKLRQTLFQGFVDISGSRVSIRNNAPLELYGASDSATPSFTITSDTIHVLDHSGSSHSISNEKLMFIKNLSENVQGRLTDLTSRTQYITTTTNGSITDISSNVTIHGNLLASYPAATIPQSAIIGGVGGLYIPTETTTFDNDNFATIKTFQQRDTVVDASVNGNLSVSGKTTLTGNVYLESGVSFYGDVSMIGNIHASTYPLEDNSDKLATTAYVQNTLFRQFHP